MTNPGQLANLDVTFLNGMFTRNTEIIGKMDLFVYARLTAGEFTQEGNTQIFEGRSNEIVGFNERMNFSVPVAKQNEARLYVEVRDKDVTTNDVVGIGWVNLAQVGALQPGRRQPYQLRLYYENRDAGTLNFDTFCRA